VYNCGDTPAFGAQELVHTDDGVQLNEVYGYAKYYNCVRVAVVSLLK
jgi:hypothetical protein